MVDVRGLPNLYVCHSDSLPAYAKIMQDESYLQGIRFAHRYLNVHVAGCTWISMVAYGVATHHQVFNSVRVEKSQEIFEVWM